MLLQKLPILIIWKRFWEYEIDMVWIGARTTGSPFAVQEISDALKGIDIPVFVKNPLITDLNLWIGAIERIYNSGVNNIFAIHRGFYNNVSNEYRNIPEWHLPIELKKVFPNLSIICDPSHIAGKKNMLRVSLKKQLILILMD